MSDTRGKDKRENESKHRKEEKKTKVEYRPKQHGIGHQLELEQAKKLGELDALREDVRIMKANLAAKEKTIVTIQRDADFGRNFEVYSTAEISLVDRLRHKGLSLCEALSPGFVSAYMGIKGVFEGKESVQMNPGFAGYPQLEAASSATSSSSSSSASAGAAQSVVSGVLQQPSGEEEMVGSKRPFDRMHDYWEYESELECTTDERALEKTAVEKAVLPKIMVWSEIKEVPVVVKRTGLLSAVDVMFGPSYRMDRVKMLRIVSRKLAEHCLGHFGTEEMNEPTAAAIKKYCQDNQFIAVPVGLVTCRSDTAEFVIRYLEARLQQSRVLSMVDVYGQNVLVSRSLNSTRSLYTCGDPPIPVCTCEGIRDIGQVSLQCKESIRRWL